MSYTIYALCNIYCGLNCKSTRSRRGFSRRAGLSTRSHRGFSRRAKTRTGSCQGFSRRAKTRTRLVLLSPHLTALGRVITGLQQP
jgi:hypothetical protein